MGAEKKRYKAKNTKGQESHNNFNNVKETGDQSITNVGNMAIYNQIVGRIKYRKKAMKTPTREIKPPKSRQFPCFIRPVETSLLMIC